MTPSSSSTPLRGKPVAQHMEEQAAREIAARGLRLGLAVVMAGHNPASEAYVAKKVAMCERVGIRARVERLPEDATQEDLESVLRTLNASPTMTGYIVQLPLPKQLSIEKAVGLFDPLKDVDGFTAQNAGKLFLGERDLLPPATARAVMHLLDFYKINLAGKHVVIVGRSNLAGKPLALEMLERDATVTVCHSKTPDLANFTRQADILVSATGRKHLITADMVREGAVLVDVGFTKDEEGLFGDISPEAIAKSSAHAPVPGGVGAVTVAQLITNVVRAYDLSL